MLKAFRAWHTYRQGTNARAWLLTILRNTFINEYRKQTRQPTPVDFDATNPMAIYQAVAGTDPEAAFSLTSSTTRCGPPSTRSPRNSVRWLS